MFGRFLKPFLETMIQKESNPAGVQQFYQALNSYYSSESAQRLNSRSPMSARHAAAPTHRAAVNKLLRFRAGNCSYLPIRLN